MEPFDECTLLEPVTDVKYAQVLVDGPAYQCCTELLDMLDLS